ncbi:hypothetical protein CPB86DRAFT_786964 [Serendipita vermifera]|nr:hypothetical protein CPB86DRAFT_786964 [Serendipita vermifera]
MASIFLFDSYDSRIPSTERKQHIKTIFDVLHVSILRQDLLRARRAWAILVRCPDVDTKPLWRIGLGLILGWPDESEKRQTDERVRFLKSVLTNEKGYKEASLVEIILALVKIKQYRTALDELEYLPSLPYQDNPVLHVYAGTLKLYLGFNNGIEGDELMQPTLGRRFRLDDIDVSAVREAHGHFVHASSLDPDNQAARYYLKLLQRDDKDPVGNNQDNGAQPSYELVASSDQRLRKRLKG